MPNIPQDTNDTYILSGSDIVTTRDYTIEALNDAKINFIGDVRINDETVGTPPGGYVTAEELEDAITEVETKFFYVNVKDHGAVGNGSTNDTAAIQAAIDYCSANGGGTVIVPAGYYDIHGPITMGEGVGLQGVGGSWAKLDGGARSLSTFVCKTATAKIIVEGNGNTVGNFNIDGGDIATGPLLHRRTASAKRLFQCIFMGRSVTETMRIDEAQNDVYIDLSMYWNAGTGLTLDKGCGGLVFYGCEFGGCGNWHLIIDETTGTGPYTANGPSHNTFDHCLFELPPTGITSIPGCISIRTGVHNVFRDCACNGQLALPTVACIEVSGASVIGIDPSVTLDGFWIANSTAGATGIKQSAGAIQMHGYTDFNGLLHGWKFDGGTATVTGFITYTGVTNRFDPAGAGDVRQNVLAKFNRPVRVQTESTDYFGLRIYQQGDSGSRIDIEPSGRIFWGSGTGATDTFLQRQSANVLATAAAFRFGNYATGSRPAASGVGKGGLIFDSTLNIPLCSDGTNWIDLTATSAPVYVPAVIATYSGTSVTAVIGDANKYLRFTGTNPTFTVPLNATVAFPLETEITGIGTATAMTIVATGGVTINKARTLVTVGADSAWSMKKVGTDEWDLTGDFV